jgi:hypothetical protein
MRHKNKQFRIKTTFGKFYLSLPHKPIGLFRHAGTDTFVEKEIRIR